MNMTIKNICIPVLVSSGCCSFPFPFFVSFLKLDPFSVMAKNIEWVKQNGSGVKHWISKAEKEKKRKKRRVSEYRFPSVLPRASQLWG